MEAASREADDYSGNGVRTVLGLDEIQTVIDLCQQLVLYQRVGAVDYLLSERVKLVDFTFGYGQNPFLKHKCPV